MQITFLELPTKDLQRQRDFYADLLELPVSLAASRLEVRAGKTSILFQQAAPDFGGAYHFAFNIPENQFRTAKEWIENRVALLQDENGEDDLTSERWNTHSLYFMDAAGNVLEFIARQNLKNAADGNFDSNQILNVSEIGIASHDVIGFADELCRRLNTSVFNQEPEENFTAIGDDNGLLIIVKRDRIWFPNSGVPAKLLPIKVIGDTNGKEWELRGHPYLIRE
jgi:catechol 2,3-dioxygenase-like lactoylglutathione lyase family enzyme